MKKTNNGIVPKIIAIGSIALVAGAGLTTGFYINNQNNLINDLHLKVEGLNALNSDLVNYNNNVIGKYNDLIAVVEDLQNQEPIVINNTEIVEVNNTVEVIKEVENPNYGFLVEELFDNNGDISFALDRLKEEDMYEIVDRLILINNLKQDGLKEVESELFDEIHRTEITMNDGTNYTFNRRDLESLRFDDDIEVVSTNFRYDDFVFKYTGTFRDDGRDRFEFEAEAVFRKGKFDRIKNIVVSDDN